MVRIDGIYDLDVMSQALFLVAEDNDEEIEEVTVTEDDEETEEDNSESTDYIYANYFNSSKALKYEEDEDADEDADEENYEDNYGGDELADNINKYARDIVGDYEDDEDDEDDEEGSYVYFEFEDEPEDEDDEDDEAEIDEIGTEQPVSDVQESQNQTKTNIGDVGQVREIENERSENIVDGQTNNTVGSVGTRDGRKSRLPDVVGSGVGAGCSENVQNKISEMEYYSKMSNAQLQEVVSVFMLDNNVKKQLVSAELMEAKFGKVNLMRLVNSYLILKKGKGYTLG